MMMDTSNSKRKDDVPKAPKTTSTDQPSLASKETRVVNLLRCAVSTLLLVTTVVVSCGVFLYMRNHEREKFETTFHDSALQVIESFHDTLERSLVALDTMSVGITSVAKATNQSFPFVTVPDFEVRGANFRIESGSAQVLYMPIVADEQRAQWEEYAMANRFHVDKAYANDLRLRKQQDLKFGLSSSDSRNLNSEERILSDAGPKEPTFLNDGTNYHPHIWSNGALEPRGDEPEGNGPYLPLWHASPVGQQKQMLLNWNLDKTVGMKGLLKYILKDKSAAVGAAGSPVPSTVPIITEILKKSQYRADVQEYVNDGLTFIAYPVFDSFDDDRQLVGVLASSIYWKFLFSRLLPQYVRGIICVVESSYNQTFAYRIDGPDATRLEAAYQLSSKYSHLEVSADINSYVRQRATPRNRAYTQVGLNEEIGKYRLRIFPSDDMAADYETNYPGIYTAVVVCIFLFTSGIFLLYAAVVEKRQHVMMETAIAAAQKSAADERDLNEFIAHEVRNPLAAAMSASTFVSSMLQQPETWKDEANAIDIIREDVRVINASLYFINDFLRSMLDIQRLHFKTLKLQISTTDVLHDVLEPVSAMLYRRDVNFEISVQCPENILVQTDSLRLKQVILNLARNSSKFVESGFIRLTGDVVKGNVELYVEDSGPGIPPAKHSSLFAKFQTSLDQLSQGTGVGLCLSKQIMTTMNGDLWLDTTYDSGIVGHPGARFVIQLNVPPEIFNSSCEFVASLPKDNASFLVLQDKTNHTTDEFSVIQHVAAPGSPETKQYILPRQDSMYMEQISLPDSLSILFVDDDAILRKLFVRAVRKIGPSWRIREAGSGEAALQLCETESFDLIFMDQYMASIDKQLLGTETVRELRTRGIQSKICGLSANDLNDSFISAGADHFLLKPMPCAAEELKRELHRILQ